MIKKYSFGDGQSRGELPLNFRRFLLLIVRNLHSSDEFWFCMLQEGWSKGRNQGQTLNFGKLLANVTKREDY
jgi:hypothetical protein